MVSYREALGWLEQNLSLTEVLLDEGSVDVERATAYAQVLEEHTGDLVEEDLERIARWLAVSDELLAEKFADLFQSTPSWPQHGLVLGLDQGAGRTHLSLTLLKQACLRSARRDGTYEQVVTGFSPRFAGFRQHGLVELLDSSDWSEASPVEIQLLAAICGLELYRYSGRERLGYTEADIVKIATRLSELRGQVVAEGGDVLFMFAKNLSWAVATLYADPAAWYVSRYGDK